MLNRASRVWAILLVLALCLSVLALGASAAGGPKSDAGTGAQLPQRTEAAQQAPLADFSEGFEDITLLAGLGWANQNNSSPLGSTGWFQGNDTVFPAQAGSTTSYLGANYNNTSGTGTISNWMMTPAVTLSAGDTFRFWTSTAAGSIWPDRLELRMSLNGASTNVGATATSVGDFTTVLAEVNPTLAAGGYPEVWTEYVVTLTAAQVPAPTLGRFAFRYFVTDGGPSGANSNYIGIDTVSYTAAAPTAVTLSTLDAQANTTLLPLAALALLVTGAALVLRRRIA
ncbi:MAG: choice-of-anchor J domain-containing protein [Anaerolineae bacterium]